MNTAKTINTMDTARNFGIDISVAGNAKGYAEY